MKIILQTFNENYIKDTFDIIKKLEWDTEFWRKKTQFYVPKINNKIFEKVSIHLHKKKQNSILFIFVSFKSFRKCTVSRKF